MPFSLCEGGRGLPNCRRLGRNIGFLSLLCCHYDKVLIADGVLYMLSLALYFLQHLGVAGDGVYRKVHRVHLVLQVEQVDHMEDSACLPGGLE